MFVYNIIVLIGFAVSPALSSAARSLATISSCRGSEFTCLDGTCISAGAVCDTYWNCPDGSDEASCYSSTNSNLTEPTAFHERYKRQSSCGLNQWRCTDGTCIVVDGKCDGKIDCPDATDETHALCRIIKRSTVSGKCVLPPYPEHGTYVAINAPYASPGQSFEYAQLNTTCEHGYGVVGDAVPYCLDGSWFIPLQKCVSFCRLDPDVSVHYNCQVPGTDSYRICNQSEPSGTLVKPECNAPVYGSRDLLLPMICQSDGKWNRIIKCKPECGLVTPYAEGLIWGGREVIRGELPWHVAIYRKPTQRRNYYEQICGGSIVTNRIVISAAHCFWEKNEKQPASNYAVATAKLFREWDHKDDKDAQKSELKSIELTPYYRGVRTNFQHDIAVLILKTPFVYYTYVRPVCLNLIDFKFNNLQLQVGNVGKVAGWGLTEANGSASPVLKVVQLPFVPISECILITPETFTESITGDKICAGYNNGTAAVCKGDSGGGLSFPETERGTTRYYLRGVVSTAPTSNSSQKCNIHTVTTFTEIYQHKDFINQFMFTTCTLPPYPDHGFYEVVGDHAAKPGDDAENVYLNVSCNHDHMIIGDNVVQCILGTWSTRMPECVRDECEWKGLKGKCVEETRCLNNLYEDIPKHPVCSRQGGESMMCCTDCQLVNNTKNAVIMPTSGRLYWKDGRKARDKCLQYLEELPYQCKKYGFVGGIPRVLDEENNCYTYKHNESAVEGEPDKNRQLNAKYPFRVLVGYGDDAETAVWAAEGFIISDNYIVTSANIQNIRGVGRPKLVAMTMNKRSHPKSTWQIRTIKRLISHPDHDDSNRYHDIALIETDTPIKFDENVLPACLHVEEDVFVKDAVIIIENYKRNETNRRELAENIQTEYSEQECEVAYDTFRTLKYGYDHTTQMCYGSKNNKTDTFCTGWAGQPLMITTQLSSCVNTAIGITSIWSGNRCGKGTRKPVGYTRIAPYVPWIESIVWP